MPGNSAKLTLGVYKCCLFIVSIFKFSVVLANSPLSNKKKFVLTPVHMFSFHFYRPFHTTIPYGYESSLIAFFSFLLPLCFSSWFVAFSVRHCDGVPMLLVFVGDGDGGFQFEKHTGPKDVGCSIQFTLYLVTPQRFWWLY